MFYSCVKGNVLGFYLFPGIATIMPSVVMIDNNPLTGELLSSAMGLAGSIMRHIK